MLPTPVVNPRISEANTELGSERCDAAVTDAQSWTTSAHTLIQCLNAVQQNSRQVRIPDKQVEMLKDQLQFQSSKLLPGRFNHSKPGVTIRYSQTHPR